MDECLIQTDHCGLELTPIWYSRKRSSKDVTSSEAFCAAASGMLSCPTAVPPGGRSARD